MLKLNSLSNQKFGFFTGLSTDFQDFHLTEAIEKDSQRRETTVAMFLDIKKIV